MPTKSKLTLVRRGGILAACAVNIILYGINRPESPAAGDAGRAPTGLSAKAVGTSGLRTGRPQKASAQGSKVAENPNESKTIHVPISLYQRLNFDSGSELNRDDGFLTEEGRAMLELDEAQAAQVSSALRAAAERLVAIQKCHAKVTALEPNSWMVEVAPAANAAKTASLAELSVQLQSILSPAKAEFLTKSAGGFLRLAPAPLSLVFSVKRDGSSMQISSSTYPYMFNSSGSRQRFLKSLQFAWIDEVIGPDVPR